MNLEGEGAKGKEDFLHKSHIIMEYNISIRMSLTQKRKLRDYIGRSES
jgi:hypothetical protein